MLDKTLIRDTILIPSVSSKVIESKGGKKIGYLALSVFAADTDVRLKQQLQELLDQGVK